MLHGVNENLLGFFGCVLPGVFLSLPDNPRYLFVHAFLDGRDTPPQSGLGYIKKAEAMMRRVGVGTIATVMGRYYAMDRDQRWDRIAKAYAALVDGAGTHCTSAEEAVTASYGATVTDEFVAPAVVVDQHNNPVGSIDDDDGVFFYNFRADRARELTRALTESDFEAFPRKTVRKLAAFATMTSYDETFTHPAAFAPFRLTRILPEIISERGLKQLRIAET